MCRQALDVGAVRPRAMARYLYNNGWHFDKRTCDYAVSLMKKKNAINGQMESVQPLTREQVDEMLKRHNVKLENNVGYDYVYVANMAKSDFFKSSITDEQHMALYIKDVIDDVDSADGVVMRQWYAKMIACGMMVDWLDMLEDDTM